MMINVSVNFILVVNFAKIVQTEYKGKFCFAFVDVQPIFATCTLCDVAKIVHLFLIHGNLGEKKQKCPVLTC